MKVELGEVHVQLKRGGVRLGRCSEVQCIKFIRLPLHCPDGRLPPFRSNLPSRSCVRVSSLVSFTILLEVRLTACVYLCSSENYQDGKVKSTNRLAKRHEVMHGRDKPRAGEENEVN